MGSCSAKAWVSWPPVQADPGEGSWGRWAGSGFGVGVGVRGHHRLLWFWTRGAGRIVRDVARRHLRMRVRVRVTAPVEISPHARRTCRGSYSYRSRTQVTAPSGVRQSGRAAGVVDRSGERALAQALPRPVNNAGEAIRGSRRAFGLRISKKQSPAQPTERPASSPRQKIVLVPEGPLRIARRFNAGFRRRQVASPAGTAE